jgi:chromosome partitioning protein
MVNNLFSDASQCPGLDATFGQDVMHTIAFVSRKGGTGKSTLAIGLGVAAMEAGHKVCLLEADPLGTVSKWRRRRTSAEPIVESINDGYALFQRVPALARRGITLTIIDTAGGWSDASTGAMSAADLCLIPTRPSPAARTTRLNGAAGSLSKRAIELNMSHVLALPAIVLRNDQQDALGVGLGVTEYAPRGKSAEEIRALWLWVCERLRGSQMEVEAPALRRASVPGAAIVDAPAIVAAALG